MVPRNLYLLRTDAGTMTAAKQPNSTDECHGYPTSSEAASQSKAVHVLVHLLDGSVHSVPDLPRTALVLELHSKVRQHCGVPVSSKLVWGDTILSAYGQKLEDVFGGREAVEITC